MYDPNEQKKLFEMGKNYKGPIKAKRNFEVDSFSRQNSAIKNVKG